MFWNKTVIKKGSNLNLYDTFIRYILNFLVILSEMIRNFNMIFLLEATFRINTNNVNFVKIILK